MQGKKFSKVAALSALTLFPILAFGQAINVRVNGDPVAFPTVGPQKVGGRVLVPLRGVMEKLGAYVSYEAGTKTVTANKSGVDVTLRLGDRSAVVNNRTVTLDVPAQEFRGSTMVPLRFVGEALGAEVRWNAATSTVEISTTGTPDDPNQYTPPSQGGGSGGGTGDVRIDSFDVDQSGVVRGGMDVRMTLNGTPGGRATFSIPGVVENVPMTETRAGVYVGTYRVPTTEALNISRANAVGRLVFGGRERLIQAGASFGIDNRAPEVGGMSPEPDSRVTRNRPNISATFDDASGSGVDTGNVALFIDNRDVTEDAQITPQFLSYRPDQALPAGRHDVVLRVRDRAGNQVTKSWSFRIAAGNDVIKSFTFEAEDRQFAPGSILTLTLVGEAGGRASYSIGERVQNAPMNEVAPGRYVANYTIRRNDNFENTPVVARLVTKAGEAFTAEATTALNVRGTLEPPTFTDPDDDAKIGSKLTLKGRAAPGSVVRIKIDYRKTALGILDLTGSLGEFEVTADNKGVWVTEPIDTNTGLGGGSATFTVTAVTVGANGKTSEPTTLKLRR